MAPSPAEALRSDSLDVDDFEAPQTTSPSCCGYHRDFALHDGSLCSPRSHNTPSSSYPLQPSVFRRVRYSSLMLCVSARVPLLSSFSLHAAIHSPPRALPQSFLEYHRSNAFGSRFDEDSENAPGYYTLLLPAGGAGLESFSAAQKRFKPITRYVIHFFPSPPFFLSLFPSPRLSGILSRAHDLVARTPCIVLNTSVPASVRFHLSLAHSTLRTSD
ncbi:hypothetical protein R3P38DRAFT_3301167, partial [Favolaschia claudopus]